MMMNKELKLHKRTEDLTGRVFGKLIVLEFAGYKKHRAYWVCQCVCGNKKDISANYLKTGGTRSCGNCNPVCVGAKFGKLTIVGFAGYKLQKGKHVKWLCKCSCGNKKTILAYNLKNGSSTSCGNCNPINVGDSFGKLVVIEVAKYVLQKGGKNIAYHLCRCECGNKKSISATHLKTGASKSCGCSPNTPAGFYSKKYNCSFDSLWEFNFVEILEYLGLRWEREPRKFKLSNNTTYTPDFYLPEFDMFIEIKGRWFPDKTGFSRAKEKTELFKEEYFEYTYYVINENKYKEWEKEFRFLLKEKI